MPAPPVPKGAPKFDPFAPKPKVPPTREEMAKAMAAVEACLVDGKADWFRVLQTSGLPEMVAEECLERAMAEGVLFEPTLGVLCLVR